MNVVITGASKGIGLELCNVALTQGHQVCAVSRTATQSPGLKKLLSDFGKNLRTLDLDVASPTAGLQVLKAVKDWTGVDLLINNAGILDTSALEESLMNSFRVNAVAPFLLTQALLPKLKEAQKPAVLQITSRMGSIDDTQSGGHYGYRASKAALNMFNKCIAVENPWLVANVVHPGWVQTDMGGASAPVKPAESARGIWQVLENARVTGVSGSFFDYQGNKLPW
jgi:NAD(P)-dependent dehydrogenase (short-subunit alcohol dehydrogenase family)